MNALISIYYFVIFTFSVLSVHTFRLPNNNELKNLTEITDNIYLIFYNGESVNEYESIHLPEIESLLKNKDFDVKHKKTIFYTPGFVEPTNANTTLSIVSSYLDTQKYNVIQVNWTVYSMAENYLQTAVPSTYLVGEAVATAIEKLIATNLLNRDSITLVGHSLGAQISGSIGRNLKKPIPLIVGLDPAGPGFSGTTQHLSTGDAKYVLVMHTDLGVYGTKSDDANLVLNVNGGIRPQPGCSILTLPFSLSPQDVCSHQMSTYFWADIVRNPGTFLAIDCDSQQFLRTTNCDKSKPITINSDNVQGINGIYYLHTSGRPPYGLGLKGI